MSVFATIQTDLISAMKSKAEVKVSTLRGLKAALQKDAIDNKSSADDDQRAFVVLKQEAKKRQDSVQAYRAAGRNDLADQEQAEWELIKQYLPAQLSEAEVKVVVDQVVQGAGDNKNFGLLMKQVMQQLDGKADGKVVSTVLKQALVVWISTNVLFNYFCSRLVVGYWPRKPLGRKWLPATIFCWVILHPLISSSPSSIGP